MTMLHRMRLHKSILKWTLAAVVVTFILFYIPDFLRGSAPGAPTEAIADVDGQPVTAFEFQRQLSQRMQMFRSQGGRVSEQMLKQLGIDRQVLAELVDERAMNVEARRLGLAVSDTEVRAQIMNFPAFQENGQFIGETRYRAFLKMQRPPMTPGEFEELVRRDLVREKLQNAVTGWISVADGDVEAEYRRRNEKVKLQVVSITGDAFKAGLTATDAEIAAAFSADKEKYRVGEKRKVRFLLIDTQALRARITPAPGEIEQYYKTNLEQFSTPEQVRASHILFKTEGKDDATVKKQAEDVLKQVKAGGDFAALATKYSEDEGSKTKGGDLDFFGRGRMVPEFETFAFDNAPGTVSDLVKSQFGYHIIKVVDKRPASQRALAEVKDQISEQMKFERAQTQATELSTRLVTELKTPADLDKVAKANGLAVKESGFFLKDEPILELGPSPQVSAQAFTLKDGAVSDAIRVASGFAFITVTGKQPSTIPALDAVKEKVRADVIAKKAGEMAKAKAAELAASLKTAPDFEKAAKAAGREVKSTELVARGSVIPDAGVNPAIDTAAFSLPTGGVSDVIPTDTGAVIIRVAEKTAVTPAEVATARDGLKREMLAERQNRFFGSYMTKAKEKMKIEINQTALQRVTA
jgi:peptidyl-prolyl cis-trans isomerase D